MPYGRQSGGSGTNPAGTAAIEGAVIGQTPALQLQKTNFIIGSAAFDLSPWASTGTLAVTANTTAAPNGATQADTLNDNDAAVTSSRNQAVTIPNDSLPYCGSCYFTLGTSAQARITLALSGGTGVTQSVDFNPANGAQISASGTGSISVESDLINGVTWFRVSVTATNNTSGNTTATLSIAPASATNASTGTIIAWGAQVEQNSGSSDLIQTDVTAVTRRAGILPPYLQDRSYRVRNLTTNYLVDVTADNGRLIITTTSVTVTLPGLAAAGPGFNLTFKNAGTGTLTVNSTTNADLIRVPGGALAGTGSQTFPYSGTVTGPYNVSGGILAVDQNSSIWEMVSTIETHGEQLFTTNATWTAPVGVVAAWCDAAAGGGGGGGAVGATTAGGGGSGGVCAIGFLIAPTPGNAYTAVIGAGGNGGSAGNNPGSNGASSNFATFFTLPGGNLGLGATLVNAFPGGGSAAGFGSGPGQRGIAVINQSIVANAAGGGTIFAPPSFGGDGDGAGSPGTGFGAGGGGGRAGSGVAQAGGNGAGGFLRIRW